MKNSHASQVKHASGMTLLELTVVILVLLSLVSILFVGTTVWRKSADRSANILNIRNVQQAVRAHANAHGQSIGDPLDSSIIVGVGRYFTEVNEPNNSISYGYGNAVPAIGTLYLAVSYSSAYATADYAPDAASYTEW